MNKLLQAMGISTMRRLILVFCLVLPATAWAQTVTTIAPGDDLARAISEAAAGDTIKLKGGDYGVLTLRDAGGEPGLPITLQSEDPGNPARLSRMDLREVSYLVLDGIVFDYVFNVEDASNIRPFQVFTTRGLVIRNSVFDGDLADADSPEEESYPTGFGLAIRSSADIRLESNTMKDFYRGITVTDCVDVAIINNDVSAMRMDGMTFAQVERVLIEGNIIRDFKRAVDSSDHADMIQFWTTRTERPSRDITIRNNVLNSGLGWFTQSIFMRNDEVDKGRAGTEMYYRDITIEGNLIINAHSHGITVGETDGLTIRNNTILHNERSNGKRPSDVQWTPRIRVSSAANNVEITANVMHEIVGFEDQPDWRVSDNFEIQNQFEQLPNYYANLFKAPLTGDPRNIKSYLILPSGPLANADLGAPMLSGGPLSDKFPLSDIILRALAQSAPVILAVPGPSNPGQFSFGISDTSGQLDPATRFDWDFGDGNTAEGQSVSHAYVTPGQFDVTLALTLPDGTRLVSTAKVQSKRPELLLLDTSAGRITSFADKEPVILDLPLRPGPVQIGGENSLVRIPREAMYPFFNARGFSLQARVRSSGGYRSGGVLFHITKSLVVTIGGRGTVEVIFNTESASEIRLSSQAVGVLDGTWTDIQIDYSADDEELRLLINGALSAVGRTSGVTRPLEHWGLVFGHPFQPQKSFNGEMDSFVLKAN